MNVFRDFLRVALNPPPHAMADDVERAAQKVEGANEKLSKDVDHFAAMIHGMRNQGRVKSKKKQQDTKARSRRG